MRFVLGILAILFFSVNSFAGVNIEGGEIKSQAYEKISAPYTTSTEPVNNAVKMPGLGEEYIVTDKEAIKITTTKESIVYVDQINKRIENIKKAIDSYSKQIAELQEIKKQAGYKE